jgi:hypothetical protein
MSPAKKPAPDVQIGVRLSPDVITRADRLIPRLEAERGTSQTRVDVLREVIMRGLEDIEIPFGSHVRLKALPENHPGFMVTRVDEAKATIIPVDGDPNKAAITRVVPLRDLVRVRR